MKLIKINPKVIEWTGFVAAAAAATVVKTLFDTHLPKPTSKLKGAWLYLGVSAIGITITRAVRKAVMDEVGDNIADLNETILTLDVNAE